MDKRIGIVGGGQLGKMMILEAKRLGFYVAVLDPATDCPASSICDELIVAPLEDNAGYFELAEKIGRSGVITYEWENINAAALETLERQGHVVYPSVATLKTIQNKFTQNSVLRGNNIAVPRFEKVASVAEIRKMGETFGYPLMLKTTTGGYDGKGTALIKSASDVEAAFEQLGNGKVALMVEEFVDFEMEVSVIACRGIDGKCVVYPIAENIHVNSILDTTIVPARITAEAAEKAVSTAFRVMEVFAGVGTFGIELFVGKNGNHGEIYVNEVAPRPHNSGHFTIEGCFADQFENHIRAIVNLPLGNAELIQPTVMVNLLGQGSGKARLVGLEEAYRDSAVKVHLYGKPESKTGRKMGHYTVVGADVARVLARAVELKKVVRVVGIAEETV